MSCKVVSYSIEETTDLILITLPGSIPDGTIDSGTHSSKSLKIIIRSVGYLHLSRIRNFDPLCLFSLFVTHAYSSISLVCFYRYFCFSLFSTSQNFLCKFIRLNCSDAIHSYNKIVLSWIGKCSCSFRQCWWLVCYELFYFSKVHEQRSFIVKLILKVFCKPFAIAIDNVEIIWRKTVFFTWSFERFNTILGTRVFLLFFRCDTILIETFDLIVLTIR